MEDVRNTIKVGNNFVVFCLLARRLVAVCSWETTFHCSRKINATSAYHQVELWSLVNSTTFVFVHKLHGCCYYHGTNKTLHFGSINQLRRKFEPLISKLHLYWRWNIGSMYVAHICSVQCTEQIAHKPHSYWKTFIISIIRFLDSCGHLISAWSVSLHCFNPIQYVPKHSQNIWDIPWY